MFHVILYILVTTLFKISVGAVGSLDNTKQAIALASSVLNSVNCTGTPNCTALNRRHCSGTSHTCGSCITSRYLGDPGDKNTPCLDSLAYTQPSVKGKVSNCWTGRPCPVLQYCGADNTCHSVPKTCLLDCSGPSYGSCQYFNVHSGQSVVTCLANDLSCEARCVCAAGFNEDSCSLTDADLSAKKSLRDASISGLQSVVTTENPSKGMNSNSIVNCECFCIIFFLLIRCSAVLDVESNRAHTESGRDIFNGL